MINAQHLPTVLPGLLIALCGTMRQALGDGDRRDGTRLATSPATPLRTIFEASHPWHPERLASLGRRGPLPIPGPVARISLQNGLAARLCFNGPLPGNLG